MRPDIELKTVKIIHDKYIGESLDLKEGFVYAYKEFLKAYAQRNFKITDSLCEPTLAKWIRNEPSPCNNEPEYHMTYSPKDLNAKTTFELIDYNVNIGVKTDRKWNKDNNLNIVKQIDAINIYGPTNPFSMFNMVREYLKSPREVKIANATVEVLLAFKSNVIVADKNIEREYLPNDLELHFARFEGTLGAININLKDLRFHDVLVDLVKQ